MSVSSPVSYQLLRLIKWRINGVIKGPNDPREGKIGLKGKMGAITADNSAETSSIGLQYSLSYSVQVLAMQTDMLAAVS